MANFLIRTKRFSVFIFQPETIDLQTRVLANSGTISAASLLAVDAFVVSCKQSNIFSKFLDVGLFCGDQLAAALVKLVYAASAQSLLSNHNFVGGDYTEATGLAGNGTTKYLATGLTQNGSIALGQSLAFYNRTIVNNASFRTMIGSGESSANSSSLNHSTTADSFQYFNNPASIAQNNKAGLYAGASVSATDRRLFYNGAQIAADASAGSAGTNIEEVYVFANNANGTAAQWWSGTGSFYAVATAMTPSDMVNLYTAVQALQTALGRNV